ncbi:helix-turn-helix domain-containing protein [Flavobacteriaceae bacterium]|nr:helix-turn-helix domain-containing protein [Flavobacteriaceae bacterium]
MSSNIKQEFGNKVRYYRKLKNLTQSQLSDKINKTEETVSNIERGITSTGIELMQVLADALEVKVSDLFNEDDIIPPYLDREKIELSREVIRLMGSKSKKFIKGIITVLKGE